MSFLSKLLKRDAEPKKPVPVEEVVTAAPPPKPPAAPPPKPAAPAPPDLERIRKELLEIASIVGDGGETISNATPDSMVELRFSDIIKIAPQAFTGLENVPSIGDLELAIVVPNLYDQLAKGRVTTSLRNLTADVPSEHVSQYTLDHGEDVIALPLALVIQSVQPSELKKRTAANERDLGQNRLPNLFTPGKIKAAAAAAASAAAAPATKSEERPAAAPAPAISAAELAAAAEKIKNFKPAEKQKPAPKAEEPPAPVAPPPAPLEEVKAAVVETPPPAPIVEEKAEEKVEEKAVEPVAEPEPAPIEPPAPEPEPEPAPVEQAAPPPPAPVEPIPEPELDEEEDLVAEAEAISKQDVVVPPEPVEQVAASATPHLAGPPPDIVKDEEEPEPVFVDTAPKAGGVMLNGLDINTATVDDMVHRLNSVGRKLAEKIVEERSVGGNFKNLLDLSRVAGVRGKKFERITGIPWRSELHKHRELITQLIGVDDAAIPDVRAVATRFKELKAYTGCIIILEDGYVLASNWENPSSDALGAFAPQMFKKIGKYVNHLKLGSIRCLTFFTEEQPITIVRSGKIFFAAVHAENNFGRKQVEVVQALAEELGGRLAG